MAGQLKQAGLRKIYQEMQLSTTSMNSGTVDADKEQNVIEWCTLFRRNPHIYCDMILGIKLKPFQTFMLWLMFHSNIFWAICSRGIGKSWIVALGAVCRMMLFPYTHVVITSSTVAQANKLVEKKIRDELIKKQSNYLTYLFQQGWLTITRPEEGYLVSCVLNGSDLIVVPCNEGARGLRSTMTVYEETRLLKKSMIDSVFDPMAQPRQAKYLENPQYGNNPRWIEECQTIYITSARYAWEWFARAFRQAVAGYYTDAKTKYGLFAGDIFLAIDNGLATWGKYRKAKKTSSDDDFRCETLNEMIEEGDDCFFRLQKFKESQTIEHCFRPPNMIQAITGEDLGNKPKGENEVRLVVADFAFATTTSDSNAGGNDNTVFLLMSLHWKKNYFERHVDYIELWEASDSIGATHRLKELFWDYDADYLIFDSRTTGEAYYNALTEPWEHPNRRVWNPHGFGLAENVNYQMVGNAKLDDYRQRVVDKQYIPCLIPIIATVGSNSEMWIDLRKQLDLNAMRFLITAEARQTAIEDDMSYYKMTSEEVANDIAPYGNVDMLVYEAINLRTVLHKDLIGLEAPRSGHRDRIVTCAYGSWIASKIENEWNKQQQQDEFDIDEIQLVW